MEIRILDQRIKQPEYATPGSAAFDLRACSTDGDKLHDGMTIVIPAGSTVMIGTGISLDLGTSDHKVSNENGEIVFAGLVLPRSGWGCKGLKPGNAPGLIDSDYHGQLFVCLVNQSGAAKSISALDRIAQFAIVPAFKPVFNVVEQFSRETVRGEGGFGSTGA